MNFTVGFTCFALTYFLWNFSHVADGTLNGAHGSVFSFSNVQGLDRVLASLPNRQMTVETVLYTRLASRVQQSVLGQFESDFIFKKKAVVLLDQ